MERSGSPMLLFGSLDLKPLHSILWKDLHLEGAGRPVEYDPECDLRALMLRQLQQIPYVKDLVKQLRRNKEMRSACGYNSKVPTEAHFSQMKKRIGVEGFRAIEEWLRHEALRLRESQPLSAVGLIQAVCVDGTDLPAWSSRDPHDTSRGLGDPDARLGRGKKGFILGYQSLFLVDIEGFPMGHVEAPANVNEKRLVEPLLDRLLGEDIEVELVAGDSQFESSQVFDALNSRKISGIIPWRHLKGRENPPDVLTVKDRIDVEGPEHLRVVYKMLRAKSESLNGRVKVRLAYSRLTWQVLGTLASIRVLCSAWSTPSA
ncbi:MAG: transposase [Candidatus Bathyarchaeia archaeon]|jgi:hypothetical protein